MLLIVAFCTSYTMQQRKITAIHETVISIFAGALPQPQPQLLPLPRPPVPKLLCSCRTDALALTRI
jgi:hypothetical protein